MKKPALSVILPIRNEEGFIAETLESVVMASRPIGPVQILVVDGESDDQTVPRVEAFVASHPSVDLRLLTNPSRTAASGLNLGIAAAEGAIVARVDGHCLLPARYFEAAWESIGDEAIGCVGGPVTTVGRGARGRAVAMAMSSVFGVGGATFRTSGNRRRDVDTVPFPVFRREVLDRVGPFSEELRRNQDDEYSFRLREHGYRVVLEPRMRTRYFSRSTLWAAFNQYLGYGFWKVRVVQQHPRQSSVRHFIPAAALILAGVVGLVGGPILGAILLAIYTSATLLASGIEMARRREFAVFLPLAYAALHLGYALGFLCGLVRFGHRFLGWGRDDGAVLAPKSER